MTEISFAQVRRHYLLNNIYPTMARATITTAIINTLLLPFEEFTGAEEKSKF